MLILKTIDFTIEYVINIYYLPSLSKGSSALVSMNTLQNRRQQDRIYSRLRKGSYLEKDLAKRDINYKCS